MQRCYNLLTDDELQMIHEASLDVLETTGLRIDHPLALEKLSGAGARVDAAGQKVRLPAEVVEKALQTIPKHFVCAGRTPEFDVTMSPGGTRSPVIRSGGGAINTYDLLGDTSRPVSIQNCRDVAFLVDALGSVACSSMLTPQDAPAETYDLHALSAMLQAGRKHIWALPRSSKNLKYQLEMMMVIAGDRRTLHQRPLCSGIVCLIEPLYFPHDEIEELLLYGRYNLPVKVPLAPMAGANAPYSLAGMLTHTNAEALGSLTLLQTLCPGIPTWYYTVVQDMEMRRGNANFISPEVMLINSGAIQLARHYGIPSGVLPFATTDCQAHQIMFERGSALTQFALSGASELGGAGMLGGGMAMSFHALVLDDELAAFARHVVKGLEVNRDTLAVEAINRVGHGGNFLEDPHTLHTLKRYGRFEPTLLDWHPHDFERKSGKSILPRTHAKLEDIWSKHEVPPLVKSQRKELDRILLAADEELLS